jgi:2-oxoglutarate dehydrogenase E2 component (dihydrolipoamide succinyltransferase)
MALIDVVMPKMGESIMEATILRWHKKPGDFIRQDETLMDIATDKVDSEVPSTTEGVLEEALFKDNDIVPVGSVIARIRVATENTTAPEPIDATDTPSATVAPDVQESVTADQPAEATVPEPVPAEIPYQPIPTPVLKPNAIRFYSPLVLNIAASEGIPMSELEQIPGTGVDGRVSKKDILDYLAGGRRPAEARPAQAYLGQHKPVVLPVEREETASVEQSRTTPVTSFAGNVEVIEMDRMRKYIAEHMVKSKATSAHVTSFAEADMTHIVQWRERIKKDYEKREGEKITYTPLIIEAIVKCLKKFPLLNSSVEGDRILVRKDINIGMATALPTGNLIVPVIKGADQLNLVGLTRQVNLLAGNARNNRLKPDDTQGGTFTFTNVGTFGSLMGTPIISQPQVAIMASGAIKKKPVVLEGPEGDSIAIRHMMFLSMSYDHRIIDGALGSTFISAVVKELENFDPNRSY